MAGVRRLVICMVLAAGVLGGVLVLGAGTAQAQAMPSTGIVGGGGAYPITGAMPVTTVVVAQFPAAGLDPPYSAATVGVPPANPDMTILRGRADATSPVVGQFSMAFMTTQQAPPSSR